MHHFSLTPSFSLFSKIHDRTSEFIFYDYKLHECSCRVGSLSGLYSLSKFGSFIPRILGAILSYPCQHSTFSKSSIQVGPFESSATELSIQLFSLNSLRTTLLFKFAGTILVGNCILDPMSEAISRGTAHNTHFQISFCFPFSWLEHDANALADSLMLLNKQSGSVSIYDT